MALSDHLRTARTLAESGVLAPVRPDRLVRVGAVLAKYGTTPAAAFPAIAARHPDRLAIVDERGALSFAELDRRANALAHALAAGGIGAGDGIAIMCRNHRGFVEATAAAGKLGATALYLNTSFAGPQITDVVEREAPKAVVYDEEFDGLVRDAARSRQRFVAWRDPGEATDPAVPTLDDLIAAGDPSAPPAPAEPGRMVILTSGTTGTPKGANRGTPSGLATVASLLSRIPFKAGGTTVVAAPMFHSWGFANTLASVVMGRTVVTRRKFDPEATLALLARHRADALAVVPVMLQRILDLGPELIGRYDHHALKIIALSGSALSGQLAAEAMDVFGEVAYNLYGSTEVAWATIATPEDLRAAPGTVGRPPAGTVVRLYTEDDRPVPEGGTGRIFVGNEMLFEGYTGGGGKAVIDGLMATGDVGHFDAAGRLFVDGRDDDMIVSGGENVFPQEVEELLASLPEVADVAVIGVDDDEFGQRLSAYVVKRPKAKLSKDDVKRHVKAHLARYKVPRDVTFVDELPRTATGKVLKRELRD
ncbi:MAG: AMP-binding protein [Solirubrobacteraceae bacterium]